LNQWARRTRLYGRIYLFSALAVLSVALMVAHRAAAQQTAPAHQTQVLDAANNPSASETPKSEEEQENGFLNAPVVHKFAGFLHISEPAARILFLLINFAIIFFAIAVPLIRTMPKVFRKRSQTLRHSLQVAREATEEARQRLGAVEAKLAGLGDEIAKFRAQVEQESLEDEKRIKAALKEESERIVAAAEQEISAAATHARRGLREFAADLAIEQASKQLTLTPETDRALIHDFIGQVASENGKGGKK
jgi:F-type H+-transporting ATPase subunit b